ncbi:ABC transporter ATP-binding protein [Streptomyces sp. NPDC002537]
MAQPPASGRSTSSSPSRSADRLLLRMSRDGRGWTAVLAVTALLDTTAQVALPALLGRTVDSLVSGERSLAWAIGCTGAVILMVVCDALGETAVGSVSAAGTAWLRHRLVDRMLAMGDRATRRFPRGDLVSRVVNNASEAGNATGTAVWTVLSVLPTIGSVIALWLIHPWLAVTFVVGLPALFVLLRGFARNATELMTQYQRCQGGISAALLDALAGIRTVRSAGTLDREQDRVLRGLPELSSLGHGMWKAQTAMAAKGALLVPLLEVAVLAVAGFALAADRMSPGDMLAAWRYVSLGAGFGMTTMLMARLARARAGARRVDEVLSEPVMAYGTTELPPGPGRLEFRDVSLSSGRSQVLNGVDLVVPAGTSLAVVGRSGTGKSLLTAVAGRLLDPDDGVVLLDGVPLPSLGRHGLRRAVGYAFERPALVGDTLARTILLSAGQPSDERMEHAARAAQAHAFIQRLPQGYRTRPEDAPLSGGEAQRIGLARAFAHDGRVLILDDATSSLDTATEQQIGSVLTDRLSDRTRLIVAHRASTAARADLVAWLDEGRVRALGSHQELWHDPAYRSLFAPDSGDRTATARPPSPHTPRTGKVTTEGTV